MKKIILSAVLLGSFASVSAFADSQVYYPENSPVPNAQSNVSRAQVKAELKQAEKSGQLKQLNDTVYFGH